jgi:hypothetical protein
MRAMLREKTAVIVFAVIVALLLLVFWRWG